MNKLIAQAIYKFPQKMVMKALGSKNPMATNLIKMINSGDANGIEQFARNLAKEKGKDPDEMFKEANSFFSDLLN